MKRLQSCLCLLMVMSILLAIPVSAEENSTERSSTYFSRSSVYLHEITTYTFKACFDVTALGVMDVLGASEIKIQRSSDGTNWTTVKTFTKEEYTYLVDEDQITHAADVTYTGTKGYYYRAKVVLYAKNSSGFAKMTEYSSKILIGG